MLPARQHCKALLGHRVRKWNARNVIARSINAQHNGASTYFTVRNGVGVGEDCRESGSSWVSPAFRSVCRPCPCFLNANAHTSERNFLVHQFCESSVTPHLALAHQTVPARGINSRIQSLISVTRSHFLGSKTGIRGSMTQESSEKGVAKRNALVPLPPNMATQLRKIRREAPRQTSVVA